MREKIEIPIMFCFDKNYVIPASVAFYSLLEHAKRDCVISSWGGQNKLDSATRMLDSAKIAESDKKSIDSALDSANLQNPQGGLPRRFCESARNDNFFRDSSVSSRFPQNDNVWAENGNSRARVAESSPKIAESAESTKFAESTTKSTPLFYRLYVLHNDISSQDRQLLRENIAKFSAFSSLEFINMDDRFAREWERVGLRAHFAKEFFYKLLLTSYFKGDKVIVSDVDVVFLGDVSESFLAFSGDEYIAGVKANNPNAIFPLDGWKKGYKNFSKQEFEAVKNGVGGGYFIANLKAWRRDNIEATLINYLCKNVQKLVLAEQDVLNIVCYPRIARLSPAHIVCHENWQRFGERWEKLEAEVYRQDELDSARKNPIQLHFVGDKKPWKVPSVPKSEIWYEYIAKTTFARRFFEGLESNLINAYQNRRFESRVKRKILRIWRKIRRI